MKAASGRETSKPYENRATVHFIPNPKVGVFVTLHAPDVIGGHIYAILSKIVIKKNSRFGLVDKKRCRSCSGRIFRLIAIRSRGSKVSRLEIR